MANNLGRTIHAYAIVIAVLMSEVPQNTRILGRWLGTGRADWITGWMIDGKATQDYQALAARRTAVD